MSNKTPNSADLFNLFVGGSTTTKEIAKMNLATVTPQIQEMRADDPDDIEMSDEQIARAILEYARSD